MSRPGHDNRRRRSALLTTAFLMAAAIAIGYLVLIWYEAVPAATTLPRAPG